MRYRDLTTCHSTRIVATAMVVRRHSPMIINCNKTQQNANHICTIARVYRHCNYHSVPAMCGVTSVRQYTPQCLPLHWDVLSDIYVPRILPIFPARLQNSPEADHIQHIILRGYFTGTGAIVRLPQCQWSHSEECGSIHHKNPYKLMI